MNEQHTINLTVTKEEALVLFDFLARFNQTEHPDIFDHQAEQVTLWGLEALLEKQLVEPFRPDYKDIIHAARKKI